MAKLKIRSAAARRVTYGGSDYLIEAGESEVREDIAQHLQYHYPDIQIVHPEPEPEVDEKAALEAKVNDLTKKVDALSAALGEPVAEPATVSDEQES